MPERLRSVIVNVLGQARLLRGDFWPGLMHATIFWGFCILTLGTIEFFGKGVTEAFYLPLLSNTPAYLILQDAFSLGVIVAIAYAMFRRLVTKPRRLTLSIEGLFILLMILGLMVTDLAADACRIILAPAPSDHWQFAGRVLAELLAHLPGGAVRAIFHVSWWLHAALLLTFLVYLPYSKHLHVLGAPVNVFLGPQTPKGKFPTADLENAETFGVGAITESDILLAKASGAIVLGFHVRPDSNARSAAEREQVDVRTYRIIYEAVEDVRNALEGLLKPEERETVLGEAEVLQLFKVSKVGTIAGCTVRSGIIQRTAKARIIRDGSPIYTGALSSLKRFKDDVREVREGLECGIGIENFNDLKVGDRIESFRMEEIKRTLKASVGFLLSREAFRRFKTRLDYSEYGGAPMLGVKGCVIICHGRSSAKAVRGGSVPNHARWQALPSSST